jgi:hypothetical protein
VIGVAQFVGEAPPEECDPAAKANRPARTKAPGRGDVSASVRVRNGCAVRPAMLRRPREGGDGIGGEGRLIACVNLVVEREDIPGKKNAGPALPEKARRRDGGQMGG